MFWKDGNFPFSSFQLNVSQPLKTLLLFQIQNLIWVIFKLCDHVLLFSCLHSKYIDIANILIIIYKEKNHCNPYIQSYSWNCPITGKNYEFSITI